MTDKQRLEYRLTRLEEAIDQMTSPMYMPSKVRKWWRDAKRGFAKDVHSGGGVTVQREEGDDVG